MGDSLRDEVVELQRQLGETFQREQEATAKEGKEVDLVTWLLGMPTDPKYPAGPPYIVSSSSLQL